MRCPYCNSPMEVGELRSRGGVFFLPQGEALPKLYTEREMNKHRAIQLPPYLLDVTAQYPVARVCRCCKKLIIEYET